MRNFKTYSKKMQNINQMILNSAETDANILIIGEKGVGKSSCARKIHMYSNRQDKNIIELTSSMLNGSDEQTLLNFLKEAEGGTLFIDEIALLEEKLQLLILKTISQAPQPFRLIASSTRGLESYVRSGKLLEELYNRLCVMKIKIPNLRDRKEDIPYLIDYFIQEFSQLYGKQKHLCDEVFKKLSEKNWPGNILELESIIEYAFIHSRTEMVTLDDLPPWLDNKTALNEDGIYEHLYNIAKELIASAQLNDTYMVLEEYKKMVFPPVLRAIVDLTNNNKSRSAELLGINRNTLKKILREYDIEN